MGDPALPVFVEGRCASGSATTGDGTSMGLQSRPVFCNGSLDGAQILVGSTQSYKQGHTWLELWVLNRWPAVCLPAAGVCDYKHSLCSCSALVQYARGYVARLPLLCCSPTRTHFVGHICRADVSHGQSARLTPGPHGIAQQHRPVSSALVVWCLHPTRGTSGTRGSAACTGGGATADLLTLGVACVAAAVVSLPAACTTIITFTWLRTSAVCVCSCAHAEVRGRLCPGVAGLAS